MLLINPKKEAGNLEKDEKVKMRKMLHFNKTALHRFYVVFYRQNL